MPSTLLTVADAAAELNLEPWEVRRAIARRRLTGTSVGRGEIRIAPADVQAAAAMSAELGELDGPELFDNWIDDRAERHRADMFVREVRKAIIEQIPEQLPPDDQAIPYAGRIREIGEAAPKQLAISRNGSRQLPYRTTLEAYAVSQIRAETFHLVKAGDLSAHWLTRDTGPRAALNRLFQTAEVYRQVVDAAWTAFRSGRIFVQQHWPSSQPTGGRITRTFSLRHQTLPVESTRIAHLAF